MKLLPEEDYQSQEGEWGRLMKDPYHWLEFLVTMHHIKKYLPKSGKVLDAGGGPGRYSIELCRAGYDVVLLDIEPEYIAFAKEKIKLESQDVQNRLSERIVGDIRDLSCFKTDYFDIVLCLGSPLTEVSKETERLTAVMELVRVAKPGAVVCLSVVGYLGMLRTVLRKVSDELLIPRYWEGMKSGDNFVRGKVWHFFRAGELRNLAESCGLTTLEMVGCEGISAGLPEATNAVAQDEAKWKRWVELVLATAAEASVVDMSDHILYIGKS